jgi:excisionase family DNA binding protein
VAGEDVVTAQVVAERLGLSKGRVYELARAGEIPHLRIGRSVRFRWSSVVEWLEAIERAGEVVR